MSFIVLEMQSCKKKLYNLLYFGNQFTPELHSDFCGLQSSYYVFFYLYSICVQNER